jgi:hypothetical protein
MSKLRNHTRPARKRYAKKKDNTSMALIFLWCGLGVVFIWAITNISYIGPGSNSFLGIP